MSEGRFTLGSERTIVVRDAVKGGGQCVCGGGGIRGIPVPPSLFVVNLKLG